MARLCGACCGLVVFSGMILRGIVAGNSPQQVILRAVAGMFAALILGGIAGRVGILLVRDNLPAPPEPDSNSNSDDLTPTVPSVS